MQQPLDLSIILAPPPHDAAANVLALITIQCNALQRTHTGGLLTNSLTKEQKDDLHWYLEDYWKWPYRGFALRGLQVEELFVTVGKQLYREIFGHQSALDIVQAWNKYPVEQRQISIISALPKVLSLPWELLHDEQGFLALREPSPVPIVRRLLQEVLDEQEPVARTLSLQAPLRILLVTARPIDAEFIDPRCVARELLDELQKHIEVGTIDLQFLRPATLPSLYARLMDTRHPIHVLHFDGHGVFDEKSQQGALVFEDDEGKSDPISAEDIVLALQNSSVRLVVLNACQSAVGSEENAFSSIAGHLIQHGIDAVIAMGASVLVASIIRYVETFYSALAAGWPIVLAQENARKILYNDPRRHPLQQHNNEEGSPVELRDWWVPQFYQRYSLTLEIAQQKTPSAAPLPRTIAARLSESMPIEPRYGFSGRTLELFYLERYLTKQCIIVLHGFGGVGKTALAREAADWFTRTGMYDGACFISFEHGGDATTLLSELGRYIGITDGYYNLNDVTAALQRLDEVLGTNRLIIIADNIESILPRGEAPLSEKTRSDLWDILLQLANLRMGVILTSRVSSKDSKQFLQSNQVVHLEVQSLHPEDAYLLAIRLLEQLKINRANIPYNDLCALLEKLEYYPLSIQLVLPELRKSSPQRIIDDFSALLPQFIDNEALEHHQSLIASLKYSLRRLTQGQQQALAYLAVFEGGAYEDALLAITEMPRRKWLRLRRSLEQAALLTREQVHEELLDPFIHFHPVLIPYLRYQYDTESNTYERVRSRYIQYYYEMINDMFHEDFRTPHPVRAVVRKELPNLRKALLLVLQLGDLEAASLMVNSLSLFLTAFGFWRERDELQRLFAEKRGNAEVHSDDLLTFEAYLYESGLAEAEYENGDTNAASARLGLLLSRIEAQPDDAPVKRGSYEHCIVFHLLARCYEICGQLVEAEEMAHRSLDVVDELLAQRPGDRDFIRQLSAVKTDLGDILREQGSYDQALTVYKEALQFAEESADWRQQAVILGQLGILSMLQRHYSQAQEYLKVAAKQFHDLEEPSEEAIVWHQLGIVADEQAQWAEAERCYRESLAIKDQLGDTEGVSLTCNQLARIAQKAGRLDEAEHWYRQALESCEKVNQESPLYAKYLNNLASLLLDKARLGQATDHHLSEARTYAEKALAIRERLKELSDIWMTLHILADIAQLKGRIEVAQAYTYRERKAYADFPGNRYTIQQQFAQLIVAIAMAATKDTAEREQVEKTILQIEEKGWNITSAVHRLWAGERDWRSLTEDMENPEALLMLMVLEALEKDVT